jgi:hypothetical protein
LFTSIALFLSHRPACPSHRSSHLCHSNCLDGSFNCSTHQDPPFAFHNHPCQLSDTDSGSHSQEVTW